MSREQAEHMARQISLRAAEIASREVASTDNRQAYIAGYLETALALVLQDPKNARHLTGQ